MIKKRIKKSDVYKLYSHLSETDEPISSNDVVDATERMDVPSEIDKLGDLGLVNVVHDYDEASDEEETPKFTAIPLRATDEEAIRDRLLAMDLPGGENSQNLQVDIEEVLGRNAVKKLFSYFKRLEESNISEISSKQEKFIIGIDLEWVPRDQREKIQGIVQELRRMSENGKGAIEIIYRSEQDDKSLAEKIKDWAKEEAAQSKIDIEELLKRVLIFAGKDTILQEEYNDIKGKAFMVGIDNVNLKASSYIRFVEMLTIAMRRAFISNVSRVADPGIIEERLNARTLFLTPKAIKMDVLGLYKLYDLQKQQIHTMA